MIKIICLLILCISLCLPTAIVTAEENSQSKMHLTVEGFPVGETYSEFFPDQKLANNIIKLNGKNLTDEVTKTDLDKITSLTCVSEGISDITGLEYMENLISIDFTYCSVSDLSPLANITKLTSIDFDGNNNIVDLSPLAELTNLETIRMGGKEGNQIVDLSPLVGLKKLTTLDLEGNNIVDVTPLHQLSGLTTLRLFNNKIIDISPLNSLTNLTNLWIGGNNISDLTPLSFMNQLNYLEARSNNFVNKDIEIINSLPSLNNVDFSGNNITDLSFFNTCTATNLKKVDFGYNHISDITPLMTYRKKHKNFSNYDVTNQVITLLPVETKETSITITNNIIDINGAILTPQTITNSGKYNSPNLIWIDLNHKNWPSNVSYTFNNGRTYSGTVNQPITYLEPNLTFDSEITYVVNTEKNNAAFLTDIAAKTDTNADLQTDFEDTAKMNTVGDYKVGVWSSNNNKTARGVSTVHVVAAPISPTITANPEITYTEGIIKSEADFLTDINAKTEADAIITSDFDSVVNLNTSGTYEVELNATNSNGMKAEPVKVIVHIEKHSTPVIRADKEITYMQNTEVSSSTFLKDIHAITSDGSPISSNMETAVNWNELGDYTVTLSSISKAGIAASPVVVMVHIKKDSFPCYTAYFDVEGEQTSEKIQEDTLLIEPVKPMKKGYTFTGWYDAKTGGSKWDFKTDKMPANDITLYAQFSKNSDDKVTPGDNGEGGMSVSPTDKNSTKVPQVDGGNKTLSLNAEREIDTTANDKHSTLPATGDNVSLIIYLQVMGVFLLLGFFWIYRSKIKKVNNEK